MGSFSAFKKCFLFFGVLLALCFTVTDLSAKSVEEMKEDYREEFAEKKEETIRKIDEKRKESRDGYNKLNKEAVALLREAIGDAEKRGVFTEIKMRTKPYMDVVDEKKKKLEGLKGDARIKAELEYNKALYEMHKSMQEGLLRAGLISEKEYKENLKTLKKSHEKYEEAEEEAMKYNEAAAAAAKKLKNAKEKEAEKAQKAAEKEQKKQDKLADKAEKQLDKLAKELKECEEMVATPEKRQACAEKAKKKYGLTDEQQAALDARKAEQEAAAEAAKAAKAAQQEQVAKEDQISGVEQVEGSEGDPNKEIGEGGNADKANGTAPGLKGVCANAGSGNTKVFAQIACKAMMFLIDLRVIAYVISGFGMVAFAYAAVFNKINWKHFSMIAIGLFLLSMIGPFISYFTGDNTVEVNLQYGNYLGGNYNPINGTGGSGGIDESETPDTGASTAAAKKKWSLKDLKGSIKSGLDMVRGAYNTVQGVKSTINTVKNNADIIKSAIKNNGGGLNGIIGSIGNISGAMNNIGYAAKTGVNSALGGISNVANNAQDMVATNQQRNINAQKRADGGSSNLVSAWVNSEQGGGAVSGAVAGANNLLNKGATAAGKATTAGHEGQKIGGGGALGDVVGGIFGAGEAIVGGIDASEQMKKEKEIEAQRQKEQEAWNQNISATNNKPTENKLFSSAESKQQATQNQQKAQAPASQAQDTFVTITVDGKTIVLGQKTINGMSISEHIEKERKEAEKRKREEFNKQQEKKRQEKAAALAKSMQEIEAEFEAEYQKMLEEEKRQKQKQ